MKVMPEKPTVYRNPEAFSVEQHHFPVGTLFRLDRIMPRSTELTAIDQSGVVVGLNFAGMDKLARAEPIPYPGNLIANITVIEELSEETTALKGTLTVGGHSIEVSCRGHGDGVLPQGSRQDIEAISALIKNHLIEANVQISKYFDPIDSFVGFVIETGGLETFAQGYKRFNDIINEMTAVHDTNTPQPIQPAVSTDPVAFTRLDSSDIASTLLVLDEAFENNGADGPESEAKHAAVIRLVSHAGGLSKALSDIVTEITAQAGIHPPAFKAIMESPSFQAAQAAVDMMSGIDCDAINPSHTQQLVSTQQKRNLLKEAQAEHLDNMP